GWRDGVRYGAIGLPLAFVALPLYVNLPDHYAATLGVPLGWLGAVLLAARLLDALVDPWIGRRVDALLAQSSRRAWGVAAGFGLVLALAFAALFHPPVAGTPALLAWCAGWLAVTYLAYSVVSVTHQAWGARLGGDEVQRGGIVAWREGLALAGVLLASVLPSLGGYALTAGLFALTLAIGLALWRVAPAADRQRAASGGAAVSPLAQPAFRRLLAVFLVNGIASAVPATLVLFFVRDRLQAPGYAPLFLASYFAAAALAMPLWLRVVARIGLARAWLASMLLAVAAFAGALALGPGDVAAYAAVCIASGVALAADLVVPGALLAGVVMRTPGAGRDEGAYFGWWNFATKLNLALAAGVALPMLQAFGYAPGAQDARALDALAIAYCVLPCLLKLVAAALLCLLWIRQPQPLTT
ncbi:MAG: MFS transporter, partial [Burkholderiaceae bacterium]